MSSRELQTAVNALFETFSRYGIDDFHGCPCCVTQEDSEKLAQKPLRELSHDDLLRYSLKAISTWGEPRHFKHFLPRLFELTIEHRDGFLDLAVVYGKLETASFTSWPEAEQRVVKQFFEAYWLYQLNQTVSSAYSDAIDTVLCAIANGLGTVDNLLKMWIETDSVHAKQHLAAFVIENYDSLLKKLKLSNSFWNHSGTAHQQVLDWLFAAATYDYLKTLEHANVSEDFTDAHYWLGVIQTVSSER